MTDPEVRILIIGDNQAMDHNLVQILTMSQESQLLDNVDQFFYQIEGSHKHSSIDTNYHFPELIIDVASDIEAGINKMVDAFSQSKKYALVFYNIDTPLKTNSIESIKNIWTLDPETQIIINMGYSEHNQDHTVRILGMGDNYLILNNALDAVALRQIISSLTKKWILSKNVQRYSEMLNQTVDDRTDKLHQSVSLLRSTLDSTADGLLVIDLKNKIIDYNHRFLTLWNIPEKLIKTKSFKKIHQLMEKEIIHSNNAFNLFMVKTNELKNKLIVKIKNNSIIECYVQPHQLNNETIGYIWTFHDITERANLQYKLEYQASHDMLTGLPNRLLVIDRLKNAIDRTHRNGKISAVLFIDLDRFKLVNDSLSHSTGDILLQLISLRLSTLVRKEDTLARLGGDEFIMITPDLTKEEHAINIATKILRSFRDSFSIAGHNINISASVGISLCPEDGTSVDELLKNADLAMYQAKAHGGNQFQFYTEELNKQTKNRFKIESELNQAILKNEFYLVYQPQFDINNHCLLSVEALLRWKHPTKGDLTPIDFMKIAEDSGLIIPIGEWVLHEVCRQIKVWQEKKISPKCVSVNIAIQQLKQNNFAMKVKRILQRYKVSPKILEFEINENILMTHLDMIDMINQLYDIGIKIVLDDFGTGKSFFNYLKHIHINRLKIDPSFINNIENSKDDEAMIEAIIAMSESFNFKVLAEGVETPDQMAFLKNQHCHQVQGNYLSQPMPAAALEKFLKNFSNR
ncbi:bifunctional diguanylate cyclase/phosphodiesterase [Legionella waltersii]|uniref:GGDEF domain-containing sensory box protein n=1 Tax=Legionella waltersii TaxID=66969 RepID=A0A0W1A0W9_9GAMM|nr:bifunctional diguanylate cyclase/phosphodiesterase [Legionella waltersii]KTD75009.1 GGDEF domain-containing sensory box protein [Legionella waltersii]SNV05581.1 sensory box protein, GGDEF family protein, LssE [Legionella waltersii]